MLNQKRLLLSVRPVMGESNREFSNRRGELLNHVRESGPDRVAPEKLFADLLKRQGRRIMADVTECPPDTIPAHLARLDDWQAIARHAMQHGQVIAAECRLSGCQLVTPSTLADWLAAAEITRREHRAPSFVNSRDEQLERIFRGIDQLAGLISNNPEAVEFFSQERGNL